MIIGEQRLGESSYYSETSHQFEGLKRKLSSENEHNLNNFNDRLDGHAVKSYNASSVNKINSNNNNSTNNKMHFVDNNVVTESYHAYQSTDQIHQDGDQSYINLTVLTPTLIQYDKTQLDCQTTQNHQNFNETSVIQEVLKQTTTQTPNIGKYEVKNYQQHHQSGI